MAVHGLVAATQLLTRDLGCTYHTVMITLRLVPDIRKGSEGVACSIRAAMSNCWR